MPGKKKLEKPLNRKEREYESRRKETLAAALKLFSQKGYHQTSMSEIAKAAEFSIGSLYNFFKNKEELYLTLFNEEIEEIAGLVNQEMGKVLTPREKLNALVHTLFNYFENRWEAFHVFALSQQEFEHSLQANLGNVIRLRHLQFLQTVSAIIKQGSEKGIFKPLPAEAMSLALIGLINGSIILWIESNRAYSLKERAPEILEIFYTGVEKK